MHWFSELIGFLIILIVLFFPLLHRIFVGKSHQKEKEGDDTEPETQQQPKPVSLETPTFIPPKTPKRLVRKETDYHSKFEDYHKESVIESRHLTTKVAPEFKKEVVSSEFLDLKTVKKTDKRATLKRFLRNRSEMQQMVIASEILHKPVGDALEPK